VKEHYNLLIRVVPGSYHQTSPPKLQSAIQVAINREM
jgi:hypothetical protein